MDIALVALRPEDRDPLCAWAAEQGVSSARLWQMAGEWLLAEQWLPPLEGAFHHDPVAAIVFPVGATSDELATRLAWRLQGSAVCQASAFGETVTKAVYGNALTARFKATSTPLCVSQGSSHGRGVTQPCRITAEVALTPAPLRGGLALPEIETLSRHPLEIASRVLACGQGTVGVDTGKLARALGAEVGYSRQRVMAGGCDEQRMLGISGQKIAPSLCLVAGVSGASAFMAGIAASDFIVAINQDPAAPIFAAADVGIVGDAEEVLTALAACLR